MNTKQPHEYYTLWEVDSSTHTIRLKTPPPPITTTFIASAVSMPLLYNLSLSQSWTERMKEARDWLEQRRSRVVDWFADEEQVVASSPV